MKANHFSKVNFIRRWEQKCMIGTGTISVEKWIKLMFVYDFLCDISLKTIRFNCRNSSSASVMPGCASPFELYMFVHLHRRWRDYYLWAMCCARVLLWNTIPKTDPNQKSPEVYIWCVAIRSHIWFRSTKYHLYFGILLNQTCLQDGCFVENASTASFARHQINGCRRCRSMGAAIS